MLKTEILKRVAGRVRAGAEGFSAFQNFSLPFRHPSRVTVTSAGSSKDHVSFCPGVNRTAMRAGELLRFHFGRLPARFVNRAPGIGKL